MRSGPHHHPLMRTIIAGANGFIGSAFSQALQGTDSQVFGLVRKPNLVSKTHLITTYEVDSLREIFSAIRPNRLILAAGSANVSASVQDPAHDRRNSVTIIESILAALGEAQQAPEIFFTSTASVYGNPEVLPVREDAAIRPISPYGEHRMQCERLLFEYGRKNGTKVLCGRAFSLFGSKQKKLVLWEIAHQALTSDRIFIKGTGGETRDYLDVGEFARRSLRAMDTLPEEVHSLNIASGVSISILELAHIIVRLLNLKIPVETLNQNLSWNPTNWAADIGLYQRLTADISKPNFESALYRCLSSWKTSVGLENQTIPAALET